eukprot:gene8021-8218_t
MASCLMATPGVVQGFITALGQLADPALSATAAQALQLMASDRLPQAAPAKPAVVAGLVELLKLESDDPAAAVAALEALIALMTQDASVGRLFVQTKKAWPLLVKVLLSDLQLVVATTDGLPSHAVHPAVVTTASSEQQQSSCPASGQPDSSPAATRASQQLLHGSGATSSSTAIATSAARELSPGDLPLSVLVILAVEAVHHMAYVPAALTLLQQSKPAIVRLVKLFEAVVAAAQQQQQQSAAVSRVCIKVSLHCASALLLSAQHHCSTRVALEMSPLDLQQLDLAVRLAPAELDGRHPEAETVRGAIIAVTPEQVLGISATDHRAGAVFKALQHLWASWTPLREALAQAPLGQAMGSRAAAFPVAQPAGEGSHMQAQQQRQVSVPGPQTLLLSQPVRQSPAPPAAPSRKRQYPAGDGANGD